MKHETEPNIPDVEPVDSELRVTEGVHGMWVYHLSRPRNFTGLCGAMTMNTAIPLDGWGRSGNPELLERWCSKCEKLSGIKSKAGEQE